MIGNKILIDTNIAITLFKGDENLGRMLQDVEAYVSFIVELFTSILNYQNHSIIGKRFELDLVCSQDGQAVALFQ